ncbi:MAG: TolB family protein [Pseudomonadota bacterium]
MSDKQLWPAGSREVTWISSAAMPNGTLRIARTTSDGESSEVTWLTDSPHNDYKPVISIDGARIAFFRTYREDPSFYKWESAICVMAMDGSNLRELTDHTYMNTEPYWMRDGSDRIIWSRMVDAALGEQGTYAFWTRSDAQPGDEEQISATNREWINSGLRDGRVFIKRQNAYYLMRPNPGGQPVYEEISYPDSFHYLHKVVLSNDETMIAYMKKVDPGGDDYLGSEIVYADFDAGAPAISNEVAFSPHDESKFSWYVSIAPDNSYLIFAENGKIMQFDVASGRTRQLSTRADIQYRYPLILGTTK